MQNSTKHMLPAWLCALIIIATAHNARADVSIDQLLFIEQGDGYAVRAQPEASLEGVLNIPAEYNGKPVVEIAPDGFKGQVKLTEVNILGSVKLINGFAFSSCVSMTKATLPEGLIKIEVGAFAGCKSLTEVNIPSTVESIGGESFAGCNLKELVIPASIKNIALYAFGGSVQKLTFSEGITHIGAETFAGLGDLQELQLPATLETIGEYAFYNCGLSEIKLPQNLKSIGEKAFGQAYPGDSKLEKVIVEGNQLPEGFGAAFTANQTSLAQNGSITLEAPNAIKAGMSYPSDIEGFNICHNYDALEFTFKSERLNGYDYKFYEVTPKEKDFNALSNGTLFIPGTYYKEGSSTYSNGTYLPVCIADDAFKGCKGLEFVWLSSKLVDLNKDIKAIGRGAFRDCDLTSLEQLPAERVSDLAFYQCTYLKNVNFPDGLKRIGRSAFVDCSSLAESNHNEGLILPNSLEEIGGGAFAGCGFYYAILPEGLESLLSTFEGCQNLVAVEIPSTVIDMARAFAGCKNLEQIYLPEGLRRIGEYCFFGCESLREIEIPSKVEYIGPNAFEGCESLETINLPEGINTIECATFQNCSSLSEINLPNSLEYIRDFAFNSCKKLKKIVIPEGVKEIGTYCFANNILEEIHIPQSIEIIGTGALSSTYNELKEVYYNSPASPLEIADDIYVFYEQAYETATLYVPSTAIDAIKATKPWCYFKDIRIGDFNGIENIAVENNAPVEIYNMSGVKIGNSAEGLTPGIYISKQGAECTKITVH